MGYINMKYIVRSLEFRIFVFQIFYLFNTLEIQTKYIEIFWYFYVLTKQSRMHLCEHVSICSEHLMFIQYSFKSFHVLLLMLKLCAPVIFFYIFYFSYYRKRCKIPRFCWTRFQLITSWTTHTLLQMIWLESYWQHFWW